MICITTNRLLCVIIIIIIHMYMYAICMDVIRSVTLQCSDAYELIFRQKRRQDSGL
jgi:hypothetical protein